MNKQTRKVNSDIEKHVGFINQHFTVLAELENGSYAVECIDNYGGFRERKRNIIINQYLFENSTIISE